MDEASVITCHITAFDYTPCSRRVVCGSPACVIAPGGINGLRHFNKISFTEVFNTPREPFICTLVSRIPKFWLCCKWNVLEIFTSLKWMQKTLTDPNLSNLIRRCVGRTTRFLRYSSCGISRWNPCPFLSVVFSIRLTTAPLTWGLVNMRHADWRQSYCEEEGTYHVSLISAMYDNVVWSICCDHNVASANMQTCYSWTSHVWESMIMRFGGRSWLDQNNKGPNSQAILLIPPKNWMQMNLVAHKQFLGVKCELTAAFCEMS